MWDIAATGETAAAAAIAGMARGPRSGNMAVMATISINVTQIRWVRRRID